MIVIKALSKRLENTHKGISSLCLLLYLLHFSWTYATSHRCCLAYSYWLPLSMETPWSLPLTSSLTLLQVEIIPCSLCLRTPPWRKVCSCRKVYIDETDFCALPVRKTALLLSLLCFRPCALDFWKATLSPSDRCQSRKYAVPKTRHSEMWCSPGLSVGTCAL